MNGVPDTRADTNQTRKVPLFLALFLLGLLGILSLWLQPLPDLDIPDLPDSETFLRLLMVAQPTVLLLIATLIGVNTAAKVGLHAPVIEGLINRQPVGGILRSQLVPAVIGGIIAAVAITLYGWYQTVTLPEVVAASGETPLLVRLLYGGITEEVLLRWGMMSLFVWLGWRFLQQRQGMPTANIVWAGNIVAALLFGVGHLPAAFMAGLSTPLWIALVVGLNALLGLLFGWLYWRRGLEAAMIAHALAHLITVVVLMPLFLA